MEPQPDPAARSPHGVLARLSARLDWYWTLSPPGRAAFWATFGGWALDAYNQMTVGFVLPAVTAAFALSTAQAGLLGSVGLVTSAVGGAVAGALADAWARAGVDPLDRVVRAVHAAGRLRTVLRAAVGLPHAAGPRVWRRVGRGRGARGGVRPGDAARASYRGRSERLVDRLCRRPHRQHIAFSLAPPELAWRIMFWLGALPAVVLLWVRTGIEESPAVPRRGGGPRAPAQDRPAPSPAAALLGLFRRDQLRVTLASALLSVGVIGAGLVIWLPTYLEQVRHLTVEGLAPTWASR